MRRNERNGTSGTEQPEPARTDWVVVLGLALILACAVIASSWNLANLAEASSWIYWTPWLLPVCMDALGIVAGKVWLSSSAPQPARVYARRVTLVTVALNMTGQAWWHVLSANHQLPGVVLVIAVGCVPPATAAVVVHMWALTRAPVLSRRSRKRAVPGARTEPEVAMGVTPVPVPRAVPVPVGRRTNAGQNRSGNSKAVKEPDEVLIRRVRHINTEHRERNGGKDITRDALRAELGCSATKASELLNTIKKDEVA